MPYRLQRRRYPWLTMSDVFQQTDFPEKKQTTEQLPLQEQVSIIYVSKRTARQKFQPAAFRK